MTYRLVFAMRWKTDLSDVRQLVVNGQALQQTLYSEVFAKNLESCQGIKITSSHNLRRQRRSSSEGQRLNASNCAIFDAWVGVS